MSAVHAPSLLHIVPGRKQSFARGSHIGAGSSGPTIAKGTQCNRRVGQGGPYRHVFVLAVHIRFYLHQVSLQSLYILNKLCSWSLTALAVPALETAICPTGMIRCMLIMPVSALLPQHGSTIWKYRGSPPYPAASTHASLQLACTCGMLLAAYNAICMTEHPYG